MHYDWSPLAFHLFHLFKLFHKLFILNFNLIFVGLFYALLVLFEELKNLSIGPDTMDSDSPIVCHGQVKLSGKKMML